jgi:hypothetical protein
MKGRLALVPVIFLVSGTALTLIGLGIMVAMGPAAPLAAGVILAAGLLDGVSGLGWTASVLFSRRFEGAPEPGGTRGASRAGTADPGRGIVPAQTGERVSERERQLALASGLLSVIFLGAVLAVLFYLHVIVGCLRGWHII